MKPNQTPRGCKDGRGTVPQDEGNGLKYQQVLKFMIRSGGEGATLSQGSSPLGHSCQQNPNHAGNFPYLERRYPLVGAR